VADRTVTGFALFFYSMPTFLLGELCLLILFYQLHLAGITFFPGSGYVPLTQDPAEWFRHLVLPWITIALVTAATYSRLTRGSMLEVLGEDYIRTARSKGIREQRVVYRHALRSALTPVVTQFGIDLGTLLGGIIVTETVFGLPGLGQEIYNAISRQDLQ
jgi:peptide/nickel transport system permease protein